MGITRGRATQRPVPAGVVSPESCGVVGSRTVKIDVLRPYIARDLAADVGLLLGSQATFSGNPLHARDIAVIVESGYDGQCCYDALIEAGIPAVYTGDGDVLNSKAADDWLTLLEVFDQLHRPGMVRAAATTMFFGETAESLAIGGDAPRIGLRRPCGNGPITAESRVWLPFTKPRDWLAWAGACSAGGR